MAKTLLQDAPAPAGVLLWERVALAALIVLVALLALINLPYVPPTWFDEGSHLHVPKTLVRFGVYADISSEGFRYFGPTIGVGPTVMLPIALAFQVAGIGLLQARLVMVTYLALALLGLFVLARRLYGFQVALLALLLALASRTLRFEGMVEYGRQALGEVPGVAFLLAGLLAYALGLFKPEQSRRYALLAGLGFGLALVTKNQFVLIVPPTLVLLALLDWLYYRAGDWWLRLAPPVIAVACFGAWTVTMLAFFGPDGFSANLAKTRQAAGGAIFVFDPEATRRAVVYLVQVYGGLLVPGLLYSIWRSRERTPHALAMLAPSLMAILWLSWFVTSLGWARYAFPAVILGSLAVARLVADLLHELYARRQRLVLAGAMLYLSVAIMLPLSLTAQVILSPQDAAQRMAAFMDANVPFDVIVETWEPELGLLTDHNYHYVPTELLDPAVRRQWLGGPPISYAGLDAEPPFVLLGPFSGYTEIYPIDVLEREYRVLYTAEPYVLLERVPRP
ncbi:ArnT family glycosyltransferase [Candidatus Viridilinea mediisalina]|uniref:Glycosyl transferase n=1 Tax=Candidatus Viridilinea mediisalina TaxID=2024553 RepID=A0A2A6RK73_9CHLR|nr:glycosyltransferase family 39 protein [Candidatus Viridilinea mediisalina]PDW03504.1 glycosyl transferase [Candidatus Viridilinea mediisalina]